MPDTRTILIGDIGGTNARFALSASSAPGMSDVQTISCEDFENADSAIRAYLSSLDKTSVARICLAVAGPVNSDIVRVTNSHWTLSAESLGTAFSTENVTFLNDFEAIARSVPHLDDSGSCPVGEPVRNLPADDDYTVAIVGPGTGLGTAALSCRNGICFAQAAEGGRVGFSPDSKLQIEVAKWLLDKFERVAAERILSGPGIENLDQALAEINGRPVVRRSSAEIFASASDGSDNSAIDTVRNFLEILGQYTGDYVLAVGGFAGAYIAGGILPRYPELLINSNFRKGFENKGKYRELMTSIPIRLITHEQPGLLGASARALQSS